MKPRTEQLDGWKECALRESMSFDLRDAEDKITDLERDLDNLRRELDEVRRRLDAIEPRANRAHNFLWTKIHDDED